MLVTSFVLLHTVHTCIFQPNSYSAQPGQHSHMQASYCPGMHVHTNWVVIGLYTEHLISLWAGPADRLACSYMPTGVQLHVCVYTIKGHSMCEAKA